MLLATTNRDKVKEIRGILAGLPVELIGLDDVPGVAAPEETGTTFEDNARIKARYYAGATGLPAIAEDSGLASTRSTARLASSRRALAVPTRRIPRSSI